MGTDPCQLLPHNICDIWVLRCLSVICQVHRHGKLTRVLGLEAGSSTELYKTMHILCDPTGNKSSANSTRIPLLLTFAVFRVEFHFYRLEWVPRVLLFERGCLGPGKCLTDFVR